MIIEKLAALANQLDDANLAHLASDVDQVMNRMEKLSQYVGTQGYWVRNERCWSNCYRQKRAKSKKSAQEIWFECQEEYQDSISKGSGKWDKYAEGDAFVKTAEDVKLARKFGTELKKRAAKGDVGDAVFAIIAEQMGGPGDEIIEHAGTLLKVAERTKYVNPELSEEAYAVADEIIKIAQSFRQPWYQRAWNWMKGGWGQEAKDQRVIQQMQYTLNRALQEAQKMRMVLQTARGNGMNMNTPAGQKMTADYRRFFQATQNDMNNLYFLARKAHAPAAMQMYQKAFPAFQALTAGGVMNPAQVDPAKLEQFISALQEGVSAGQSGATQSTTPENTPAKTDGAAAPTAPTGGNTPTAPPAGGGGVLGGGFGMPSQNFQGNNQGFSGQGANQQGVNNNSTNINMGDIFSQMVQMFKDQGMSDAQARLKARQRSKKPATTPGAATPTLTGTTPTGTTTPTPTGSTPLNGTEEPSTATPPKPETVDATIVPPAQPTPQLAAPAVPAQLAAPAVPSTPAGALQAPQQVSVQRANPKEDFGPTMGFEGAEFNPATYDVNLPENPVFQQVPANTPAPTGQQMYTISPDQLNTTSLPEMAPAAPQQLFGPQVAETPAAAPTQTPVAEPTVQPVAAQPELDLFGNPIEQPVAAAPAEGQPAPMGNTGNPQKWLFNPTTGLPTQDARARQPRPVRNTPVRHEEAPVPAMASVFSKELTKTASNETEAQNSTSARTVSLFRLLKE